MTMPSVETLTNAGALALIIASVLVSSITSAYVHRNIATPHLPGAKVKKFGTTVFIAILIYGTYCLLLTLASSLLSALTLKIGTPLAVFTIITTTIASGVVTFYRAQQARWILLEPTGANSQAAEDERIANGPARKIRFLNAILYSRQKYLSKRFNKYAVADRNAFYGKIEKNISDIGISAGQFVYLLLGKYEEHALELGESNGGKWRVEKLKTTAKNLATNQSELGITVRAMCSTIHDPHGCDDQDFLFSMDSLIKTWKERHGNSSETSEDTSIAKLKIKNYYRIENNKTKNKINRRNRGL